MLSGTPMAQTLSYLLVANRSIQDSSTSKFTFVDIFDNLTILEGLNEVIHSFSIGGRFLDCPGGPVSIAVQLIGPDGKEYGTPTIVSGAVEPGDVHFAANFPYFTFSRPGRYTCKVTYNVTEFYEPDRFCINVTKA